MEKCTRIGITIGVALALTLCFVAAGLVALSHCIQVPAGVTAAAKIVAPTAAAVSSVPIGIAIYKDCCDPKSSKCLWQCLFYGGWAVFVGCLVWFLAAGNPYAFLPMFFGVFMVWASLADTGNVSSNDYRSTIADGAGTDTRHWSELTGDEMRARWGYAAAGLDDQEHLHAAVSSGPSRLGTEQPLLPPADAVSPSDRLRSRSKISRADEEPGSVRSDSPNGENLLADVVVPSSPTSRFWKMVEDSQRIRNTGGHPSPRGSPSTTRQRDQPESPSPAKPTYFRNADHARVYMKHMWEKLQLGKPPAERTDQNANSNVRARRRLVPRRLLKKARDNN